jgi:hypothetical protein
MLKHKYSKEKYRRSLDTDKEIVLEVKAEKINYSRLPINRGRIIQGIYIEN